MQKCGFNYPHYIYNNYEIVYIYIYTYMHKYIHTHTRVHTYRSSAPQPCECIVTVTQCAAVMPHAPIESRLQLHVSARRLRLPGVSHPPSKAGLTVCILCLPVAADVIASLDLPTVDLPRLHHGSPARASARPWLFAAALFSAHTTAALGKTAAAPSHRSRIEVATGLLIGGKLPPTDLKMPALPLPLLLPLCIGPSQSSYRPIKT